MRINIGGSPERRFWVLWSLLWALPCVRMAVLCKYWAQHSVSTKQINNDHLTDSLVHLAYQIYLRKLIQLANTDSTSACQLRDSYLLWRREKPVVLRGFEENYTPERGQFPVCLNNFSSLKKKKKKE